MIDRDTCWPCSTRVPDVTPADTDASQGTETSDATTADSSTTPVLDEFGGTIGQGQVRTIRAPWGASTVTRVLRCSR